MKKLISILFALTFFIFGSAKAIDKDSDNDWSGINILFLVWTAEEVEFFVPSINGAHDAAEDQGVFGRMAYAHLTRSGVVCSPRPFAARRANEPSRCFCVHLARAVPRAMGQDCRDRFA